MKKSKKCVMCDKPVTGYRKTCSQECLEKRRTENAQKNPFKVNWQKKYAR